MKVPVFFYTIIISLISCLVPLSAETEIDPEFFVPKATTCVRDTESWLRDFASATSPANMTIGISVPLEPSELRRLDSGLNLIQAEDEIVISEPHQNEHTVVKALTSIKVTHFVTEGSNFGAPLDEWMHWNQWIYSDVIAFEWAKGATDQARFDNVRLLPTAWKSLLPEAFSKKQQQQHLFEKRKLNNEEIIQVKSLCTYANPIVRMLGWERMMADTIPSTEQIIGALRMTTDMWEAGNFALCLARRSPNGTDTLISTIKAQSVSLPNHVLDGLALAAVVLASEAPDAGKAWVTSTVWKQVVSGKGKMKIPATWDAQSLRQTLDSYEGYRLAFCLATMIPAQPSDSVATQCLRRLLVL